MLNQLFQGLPVGLYGDGEQERDWIFVQDFCEGLFQILQTPLRPSSTRGWILAGQNRRTNRQVARELIQVCRELDPRLRALSDDLIQFVKDRPGHDRSYRVDDSNERTALEWKPNTDWTAGLRKTVQWYWAARGKNALSGS
jgi:dTDP-glucose 4,6-dehydratase